MKFNADWRFHRGYTPCTEHAAFDDSGWRVLNVPHDYNIEDAPPPTRLEPSFIPPVDAWKFEQGDDSGWSAREFDDSSWKTLKVPETFGSMGHTDQESMGWYRSKVVVPENLRWKDFLLKLCVLDDACETFFNG